MSTSTATEELTVPPTQEPVTTPNGTEHTRTVRYQLPQCRTVDDFIFEADRIGEGTYGAVFKARDRVSGEVVALKKMPISQKDSGVSLPGDCLSFK